MPITSAINEIILVENGIFSDSRDYLQCNEIRHIIRASVKLGGREDTSFTVGYLAD